MAKGAERGEVEQATAQSKGLKQAEGLKARQSKQIHDPNWQTADEDQPDVAGRYTDSWNRIRLHRLLSSTVIALIS